MVMNIAMGTMNDHEQCHDNCAVKKNAIATVESYGES